jgi:hypothetical protein
MPDFIVVANTIMTQGRKNAVSKTGDHNLDIERMQYEKDKGNIPATERDYVNKETKTADVYSAMGKEDEEKLSSSKKSKKYR